jgi:glycogen operon protein
MLLMGDEVAHTQHGNNNPYCQDNEITWMDWSEDNGEGDLRRFVRELIRFRQRHSAYQSRRFWSPADVPGLGQITWHGVRPSQPDWRHDSHSLAFTLRSPEQDEACYVAFNAYWESLCFQLPAPAQGRSWHRVVDTALPSPQDVAEAGTEMPVDKDEYWIGPRTTVILVSI